MTEPAVSVLLPVYNASRYVVAAIDSILKQTFRDFELLVLDDGSTDSSADLIHACAASDSRVRAMFGPNQGLVPALNRLVSEARGELLARMDADDLARPERLAKQTAFLGSRPECVLVGSRALFIDPEGLPIHDGTEQLEHEAIERDLFVPSRGIVHPSVIMRRSAVVAVGGYSDHYPYVEDLDLFLRLGEIGKLANLPDVLLEYRQHRASVSHSNSIEQQRSGLEAVRDACRRRGIPFEREGDLGREAFFAETQLDVHARWAWLALGAGHLGTARRYAWQTFRNAPARPASWRLLGCALRGW